MHCNLLAFTMRNHVSELFWSSWPYRSGNDCGSSSLLDPEDDIEVLDTHARIKFFGLYPFQGIGVCLLRPCTHATNGSPNIASRLLPPQRRPCLLIHGKAHSGWKLMRSGAY
ncbi:hypothetical protein ABZP36_019487 [Zizania latifolia]